MPEQCYYSIMHVFGILSFAKCAGRCFATVRDPLGAAFPYQRPAVRVPQGPAFVGVS